MNEQAQQELTVADRRDALKTKRAGQTAITVFVVFVISLFSFGNAPFSTITGTDDSRMNFNLISCLGIAMGVFAFFFVLTNGKRILRLSTAKKVLGLIGSIGLITHTILALFLPFSCEANVQPAGTAGYQPLAVGSSEQWVIDGHTYNISSTYFLRLPEGLQFTIEYPYQFGNADRGMNDARALEIAFPLMEHAYTNECYKRTAISKIGQGKETPSRIGIVLLERQGGTTRGYRVGLSLDRIKERIEGNVSGGSSMSPNPDSATP